MICRLGQSAERSRRRRLLETLQGQLLRPATSIHVQLLRRPYFRMITKSCVKM